MGFRRLEEIYAYRSARAFSREIDRLVDTYPNAAGNLEFRDQLTSAASSITANIAEGFGRFAMGEFAQFLRVAGGSLHEAVSRIGDGIDRGYFSRPDCQQALELADETGRLLSQGSGGSRSPESPRVQEVQEVQRVRGTL